MVQPLTAQIGRFIAQTTFSDLPEAACQTAKLGFVDAIAVAAAGVREPAVRLLCETFGGAVQFPSSARAHEPDKAALFKGVATHILDYDDVALQGHPSAVLVPAIMSIAEIYPVNGRDMILAYVLGYEVWADLIARDSELHHNKGWHPTAVFGVVGAAAATAKLLQLDAEKSAHAIAIAASMAGGLVANFGSMTKSLHAGLAAQSAVRAALLARGGFTGASDAIEHKQGYLYALSPSGHVDVTRPATLGGQWRITITGLNLKRYPVCYCASRLIDSALDIAASRTVDPHQIRSIDVYIGQSASRILRNTTATTGLEAKFSAEFAVASALIAGRVGLNELTDSFVSNPVVQTTAQQVRRHIREDVKGIDLPVAASDRVDIILLDGRMISGPEVTHARGSRERPLSKAEVREKFDSCLRDQTPSSRDSIFDRLWVLEELETGSGLLNEREGEGNPRSCVRVS